MFKHLKYFTLLCLTYLTYAVSLNFLNRYRNKHELTTRKLVVITGCDSGFGLASSKELHKLGYVVLSTCLTDSGVKHSDLHTSCVP